MGLKGASIAERHVRETRGGKHDFESLPQFVNIFKKLGYEEKKILKQSFWETFYAMKKTGKFQKKDNLFKWFLVEAIDPKNGKARLFRFPIKE